MCPGPNTQPGDTQPTFDDLLLSVDPALYRLKGSILGLFNPDDNGAQQGDLRA